MEIKKMNAKVLVEVETLDEEGKPLKLCLLKPNVQINKSCDIEYKKAWVFLLRQGIPTHKKLLKDLEDNGVWTKENEKQLSEISVAIGVQVHLMEKFNKQEKEEDARKAALEIAKLRNESYELVEIMNQAYTYSCEGGANEIRHEAYVAYAAVHEKDFDEPFFKNYEDFKNRRDERAAVDLHLAYMQNVIGENQKYITDLPENKFLVDTGYLTKELKRKMDKPTEAKKKKPATKKAKKKTIKKKG